MKAAAWWLGCAASVYAAWAQDVRFANASRYIGNENWEWILYASSPVDVLARIQTVTYKLHPTFTPRFVTVPREGDGNAGRPFGLRRIGWGTFRVEAKVKWTNGAESKHSYDLQFVWKAADAKRFGPIAVREVKREPVGKRKVEYTIGLARSTLPKNVTLVQYVTGSEDEEDYGTDVLGAGPAPEIAYPVRFKAVPGTEITIRVFLSDGQHILLRHELSGPAFDKSVK